MKVLSFSVFQCKLLTNRHTSVQRERGLLPTLHCAMYRTANSHPGQTACAYSQRHCQTAKQFVCTKPTAFEVY